MVVVGVGPWVNQIWKMLELPKTIEVKGRDGKLHRDVPMWTFWCLQEGTLGVDPNFSLTNDGSMPPVIHVDTDAPLHSDVDGSLITDKLWGIYYKPDFNFNGVQGGASRTGSSVTPTTSRSIPTGRRARSSSSTTISRRCGARCWPIARSASNARSAPTRRTSRRAASAALRRTAFRCSTCSARTCYVIADSNHGYKMIGIGKLVAQEILPASPAGCSSRSGFRAIAEGKLHPVSNSPFPWS